MNDFVPPAKRRLPRPAAPLIDVYVGERIFKARLKRDLTLQDLAGRIGVSYQQLQKYEIGFNRVGASRLWMIAKALDQTIAYFFPCDD